MKATSLLIACAASILIAGCATSAHFKIPDNSTLYVANKPEPVKVDSTGLVKTRPFFWNSAGGIPYRLDKDGATLKQGKLKSQFRVVSIFWPPYAIIYWPFGFRSGMTYDLVNDAPEAPAAAPSAAASTPSH
jgi:hypothetical protein